MSLVEKILLETLLSSEEPSVYTPTLRFPSQSQWFGHRGMIGIVRDGWEGVIPELLRPAPCLSSLLLAFPSSSKPTNHSFSQRNNETLNPSEL